MEARKPDGLGSNTPIGLASAAASLTSPAADFASSGASSAASSSAPSSSSGTRRSLRDSDAAGEVDEAPTKRAKYAASADQQHRAASLGSLATVELQLVMQCLDRISLIKLANCSKTLQRASDHPFAWVCVPAVRVGVATDTHAARLPAGVSRHAPLNIVHAHVVRLAAGVSRHGPLDIVHMGVPGAGLQRFDLAPLMSRRVTKLKYTLPLTDGEIDVIRQMRWLIEFNTWMYWNEFDRPRFDRLLAPGHRLDKLEHLDLGQISIDDAAIHLLAGLPSLSRLDPANFNLSDWSLLTLLSNLTHVVIRSEFKHTAADVQAFYTALASLQQLVVCRISMVRSLFNYVRPAIVAIPPLPRLRQLSIQNHAVESFAFLRNLPQLERLCLSNCTGYTNNAVFATLMANWPVNIKKLRVSGGLKLTPTQRHEITARI